MLEKLAPAFLAGAPTIVKPAAQTAYLTEAVVRRIIESGILPEGTLQLLCRQPGTGSLDELTVQDQVGFTGSAHTAGLLRTHTNVLHGGVELTVEADSLNCSILGPDVSADDPEFDLFVKGVVTEMTVKAGQKCTAIRRVLVPARAGRTPWPTRSAARLAKITVGDPRADDVRMGALVSLDQREEVRKAIQSLRASAEIVYGDPDRVEVVGRRRRARRVPVPGAAAGPATARSSRTTSSPSARSAPCSPTTTSTTPIALAARGKGSLVGSRGHPRPGRRAPRRARRSRRGTAGSWSSTATTPGSPPATARRCPCWCTAAPAAPAAARSSAASAASCTTCSAPRSRPRPTCSPRSPAAGPPARPAARTASHPFRKSLAELRIGDTIASAAAPGHAAPTSTTSPSSPATRSTPTPTPRPPRPTRSSAASSPTATWWSRWPPGCSSTPTRARCWPTSASTACASSPRSRPTTPSR